MYETGWQKAYAIFLSLLSKYLIWIIIAAIFIIWHYFPELMKEFGQFILFWGPAFVLIMGLVIALSKWKWRLKIDEKKGFSQYEIIVTKFEIYFTEILIYAGTLCLLIIPYIWHDKVIAMSDLVQALLFFALANWLKNVFVNKINQ